MTADNSPEAQPTGWGLVIAREFNAPRTLVWKAWTDAKALGQWWGPRDFTVLKSTLDLRPGGVYHYGMRAPNGMEMWGKFVYREVVPTERLVFVTSFSDAQGGITRNPWIATWPLEVLGVMTLTEQGGKTTVRLEGCPINATEEEVRTFEAGRESMQKGFEGTWSQLDGYLARAMAARTITITKEFDAPSALVFQALIEPEHLVKWMHATEGWTTPFAETDPWPGGAFRIGFQSPDRANDFVFEGVYNEVAEPERLVYTIADGRPVWITFEEAGKGRTKLALVLTLENENPEDLQRQGWSGMLEHLAGHLRAVQTSADAPPDRSIVMTRVFNAPREMVFDAYTDPQQIGKWWGPDGFRTTTHAIDIRPGGMWRFIMHGPDGTDYPNRIAYLEVTRPERLVFDHGGDVDNDPDRFRVTVTFGAVQNNRTRVTQQMVFPSPEARQHVIGFGAMELGYQTLGRLAEYLTTMRR